MFSHQLFRLKSQFYCISTNNLSGPSPSKPPPNRQRRETNARLHGPEDQPLKHGVCPARENDAKNMAWQYYDNITIYYI